MNTFDRVDFAVTVVHAAGVSYLKNLEGLIEDNYFHDNKIPEWERTAIKAGIVFIKGNLETFRPAEFFYQAYCGALRAEGWSSSLGIVIEENKKHPWLAISYDSQEQEVKTLFERYSSVSKIVLEYLS